MTAQVREFVRTYLGNHDTANSNDSSLDDYVSQTYTHHTCSAPSAYTPQQNWEISATIQNCARHMSARLISPLTRSEPARTVLLCYGLVSVILGHDSELGLAPGPFTLRVSSTHACKTYKQH